jgi:valyl-tRNA synthetase
LNKDLTKAYEPKTFEKDIYQWWEDNDYFKPEKQNELDLINSKSRKYCLTLPPPNVTGVLHLGQSLTVAIEDLMVRYERMKQKETLWVPGSDHAGIATQNVVERELRKQGINRKELGRENFVEKVWEWKYTYHKRITEQSKRLGMSCDWSRERFTLDENLSKAVFEAFYRLYKKGLIYRGKYLVNWCPRCESAISDLESIPEELTGFLWYMRYPIINENWNEPQGEWGSGNWAKGATKFIEVATTRPETLLGDTAVATTANHKSYGKLIGKLVVLPVNGRKIPIIVDQHVDPEFGTGAVKVTPAHDPNDFEIGQRHDLEAITVIDKTAHMKPDHSGIYAGMDRFEARQAIIADLDKEGLLAKIENYNYSIGHCQRCDTIIEPRVSIQWFVKTKTLAEAVIKRVQLGETKIIPERESKRFFLWMENIKDWCISRQLWWGHRIPVWNCQDCNEEIVSKPGDKPISCPSCKNKNLIQDPDVLDTWFSSGLWPFSTLGWPDINNPDFIRYYPNDMRETGYDILFFWVAREMMLGVELTNKVPYHTVYLHGIVRNEKGKKISKSMENIDDYDPLHLIAEYGADSLRYSLVSNSVPGLDQNLDLRQLDAAHRYCNKIWQSTKFVLGNLEESEEISEFNADLRPKLHFTDRWILSRLNNLINNVNNYMNEWDYLKAARETKSFFWNEFCDWYIESTKIRLYNDKEPDKLTPKIVLLHVLDRCFRLLHPFIPYMTEVLWQALPQNVRDSPALIVANWPESDESFINKQIEKEFTMGMDVIREIRRVRKEFNIKLNAKIPLLLETGNKLSMFENIRKELITLGKVDGNHLVIASEIDPPKHSARIVLHGIVGHIPLDELIDLDVERNRIEKRLNKVNLQITQLSKKLTGPFSEKAKPEVVIQEKNKLTELQEKGKHLKDQISTLK